MYKITKFIDSLLALTFSFLFLIAIFDSFEFLKDPVIYSSVYHIEKSEGWVMTYYWHNYISTILVSVFCILGVGIKYYYKATFVRIASTVFSYGLIVIYIFTVIYKVVFL